MKPQFNLAHFQDTSIIRHDPPRENPRSAPAKKYQIK